MVRFPNRTGSSAETLDKANPENPSILFQTDVLVSFVAQTFSLGSIACNLKDYATEEIAKIECY